MAVAANQITLLGGTLNGNYKNINELSPDVRNVVQNFDGLVLIRESTPGNKRTTGTLWYKGQVLLFTVEDIIRKTKIKAKTAIPDNIKDPTKTETFGKGSYYVTLDITAEEGLKNNYVKFPNDKRSKFRSPGVFPRVGTSTSAGSLDFDGLSFGGIRIHDGTSEQSSAGCIIVSRTRKSDGTIKYDLPASHALTKFIYNELGLKDKAYTRIIVINEFELPQPTINDIIKSEGTIVNSDSNDPIEGVTVEITDSPLQLDDSSPKQEEDTEFTSIENLFQQSTPSLENTSQIPSQISSLPTFKVNSAYLKLKKEPKNSSETLEILLLQNEVEMLNGNFVKDDKNTWVNVKSLKSKNIGWVLSKFLNPLPISPSSQTTTPGTSPSTVIAPITIPVSSPIEPISNGKGIFSLFIPPSDVTNPEDISKDNYKNILESIPTTTILEKIPKITISAPGYEIKEIIPYRGDGTQKPNLGIVELTPLKTSLDNDIINISQLTPKLIEELSKSRKTLEYFSQKKLTDLVIDLKRKAIPLVLSSISSFGITKANELISEKTGLSVDISNPNELFSKQNISSLGTAKANELLSEKAGLSVDVSNPNELFSKQTIDKIKYNDKIANNILKFLKKNKSYCPSKPELNKLITKKNKLVKQLNSSLKTIERTTQTLGITGSVITTLEIAFNIFKNTTIPSSVPPGIGLPVNVILGIQDNKDKIDKTLAKLKSTNSGLLTILVITRQTLTQLLQLLSLLDSLIQECSPDSDETQEQLSSELIALTLQQTQQESPIVTNVNGFKMEVETEPTTNSLKRRRAIARNKQGVVMLKGEWSFSSIDQILIDELVFYIQQNNLKAE